MVRREYSGGLEGVYWWLGGSIVVVRREYIGS